MSLIKWLSSIVFILVLSACATTNHKLSSLLPPSNYLLIETAVDKNIDDARAKTLSMLAQDIFVTVKSNFSSKEVLDQKGVFSANATNLTNVDSSGYFQDITFSEAKNLGKKGYKISAGLSSKALLSSISYLQNNLKTSSIDSLSKKDLQEEYNKTNFLIALIFYAKSHNLVKEESNLSKIINYQKSLELRLSNAAQVVFNILPDLNSIAKINIINTAYKANEVIFLPPNTYYYTVFANGYKTKTNRIDLQANDKVNIDLYMQVLLHNPINIKLLVLSNNSKLLNNHLKQQIKNLLINYQLQANDFTNNKLQINFLDITSSKLNDYYYFNLPVEVSLIRGDKVVISKIFNIQYVGSNINSNISSNFILQKLNLFLEEITAGNNLNKAYKYKLQ